MSKILPPTLPEATISYYKRHLRAPDLTVEEICEQVDAYVKEVKERGDAFHDSDLAARIAEGCCALAKAVGEENLIHVKAAALYLIDEDDAEDDDSPFGFDDDMQVFNAVARFLDREDLVLSLE